MIRYRLNGSLSPMREEEEYGRNDVRIELMTIQEFEADKEQISHKKLLLRQLEQIQYCKAEIFGSCIIGTFAVPNVKNLPGKKESFGFHMVKDRLIFVEGGGEHVKSIFDRMREIQYGEQGSMSAFFTGFLNYLIEGDSIFLQGYENKLIVMEDKMTKGLQKIFYEKIIRCRKDMLHLQSFLTQLADMADIFRSNTNHLFEAEEKEGFAIFAHRVERLGDHVSLLREYILQIREMYQSQIDIAQNRTMGILTVVTTIFLPLTLLVGWYGMNFTNMPELTWKYGYPAVGVLSIIIIILEIRFFRKRNLL